jgi:Na+-driven multidrug efflux pump
MLEKSGAMGAHNIAIRIEAISYMPGMAMGVAAATLMGQYLGLGDPARARRAVKICWFWCTGIMGTMGAMFVLFPQWFVGLLTDEKELLILAPPLIRICGPIEVFFATAIVCSLAIRGAGATKVAMAITLGSSLLVRIPAAYYLGIHLGWGLKGIWYALCGELAFRGILFGVVYLRGDWAKVKI